MGGAGPGSGRVDRTLAGGGAGPDSALAAGRAGPWHSGMVRPARHGGWLAFMAAAGGVAGYGFTLARGGRLGRVIGIFALVAMIGCGLIWLRAGRVAAPRIDRPLVAFEARIIGVERLPARGSIRLKLAPIGEAAIPPLI